MRTMPLLSGLLAVALSGAAMAAQPSTTGLGQAWPNAQDVSASPHWHVYVFDRGGIHYIQVNDINGRVHGAVATANGTFLVLPMGDAEVSTPDDPGTTAAPDGGETVYHDSAVQVIATPQANGAVMLRALPTCNDPVECNTHFQ